MGEAFAEIGDVAARWRPLTPDEETVAWALLKDASALIRARFPGVESQVDSDVLVAVVAGMVKRALVAPNIGVSQESETAGPWSHSQSYANPMGNVFITTAERTLILGQRLKGMTVRFV